MKNICTYIFVICTKNVHGFVLLACSGSSVHSYVMLAFQLWEVQPQAEWPEEPEREKHEYTQRRAGFLKGRNGLEYYSLNGEPFWGRASDQGKTFWEIKRFSALYRSLFYSILSPAPSHTTAIHLSNRKLGFRCQWKDGGGRLLSKAFLFHL